MKKENFMRGLECWAETVTWPEAIDAIAQAKEWDKQIEDMKARGHLIGEHNDRATNYQREDN